MMLQIISNSLRNNGIRIGTFKVGIFYTNHQTFHSSLIQSKKDDGVYKNMKSVTLRNRIDDHDFQTKLSNIFKWLEKGQVVRAVIQNVAKDQAKSDLLVSSLVKSLAKKAKVEQVQTSEKEIRIAIHPIGESTASQSTTTK